MARNLDPKCKQCRRAGVKLFLKGERCFTSKCAMVKRNYPPGSHGPKGKPRISEYGIQLQEKQKLIKTYRLLEKQFKITFTKAKKLPGKTGENLLILLETRLDNIIHRLQLAKSRDKARQMVSHGHILINGKKVNIPSYQVKTNDEISVKPNSLTKELFKNIPKNIHEKDIPSWLSLIDKQNLKAKMVRKPTIDDIQSNIDTSQIVEYYSR